jgi:hypothetical protein
MRRAKDRTRSIPVIAFAVAFAAAFGTGEVHAAKPADSPSYVLHVLALPPGFASAVDVSINDRHEIVGTVRVGISGGHSQAAYWAHADAAPVLLPCLSEPCESRARSINNLGVVSGGANDQALLWHPSGTGWIPEVLLNPFQLDGTARAFAYDVLDDGTASGLCDPTELTLAQNTIPVIWGVPETVTMLPVPEGFIAGSARRMNDSRDAVGTLEMGVNPDGSGGTYVYGSLWVNEGGTYVTVPLTYFANDITPRAADGSSFLVASEAGRIRVFKDADSWSYVVEASPGGPGLGINAAGDMVGFLTKGGWNVDDSGTPYLLNAGGVLTALPLPLHTTGIAAAVSADRWVAGWLYLRMQHPAAVWAPPN